MNYQSIRKSNITIEEARNIVKNFDKDAFQPFGKIPNRPKTREVQILRRTRLANGNPKFCVLKQVDITDFWERERREKDTLENCQHNNILRLFRWEIVRKVEGKRQLHLYSEKCDKNLRDLLDDNSQPKLRESPQGMRNLTMQLLMALDFLHNKDIMHRDIKPENILVNNSSDVNTAHYKLADFGFARYVPKCTSGSLRLTSCGTETFSSPEVHQALQNEQNFPFVPGNVHSPDIFSLGVVIHFCGTGKKKPFTPMQLSQSCAPKPIPHLDKITDDILRTIIEKMLTWDVVRPTAAELLCNLGLRSDIIKMESESLKEEYYLNLSPNCNNFPKSIKIGDLDFPPVVLVRHLMLLSTNEGWHGHEWQDVKAMSKVPEHVNVLKPLGLWRQKLQYAFIEKDFEVSLGSILSSGNIRLTAEQSQSIFLQIHAGLNHVHAHGMQVHGNLEPENICLVGVTLDNVMKNDLGNIQVKLRGFGLVSRNGSRHEKSKEEDVKKLMDIVQSLGFMQRPAVLEASIMTDSNDPLQRLLKRVYIDASPFKLSERAHFVHVSPPDLLVVGTSGGKVIIFSFATTKKVEEKVVHRAWINSISSNNHFIVLASSDKSVSVLDKKNNLGVMRPIRDQDKILCASINEDFLVAVAHPNKAKTVRQDETFMLTVPWPYKREIIVILHTQSLRNSWLLLTSPFH